MAVAGKDEHKMPAFAHDGGDAVGLGRSRTILVAALSPIRQDGRILRQVHSILGTGRRVVAIGYPDAVGLAPVGTSPSLTFVDHAPAVWRVGLKIRAALAFGAAHIPLSERLVLGLARIYPGVASLTEACIDFVENAIRSGEDPADFALVANDWTALPAAITLCDRFGIPFHYDTHEFATEEHAHSLLWRLIFPRMIRQIEMAGISRASSVSCPSAGIRRAMTRLYQPRVPIECIRNVPDSAALPPRPTGERIEVLYHGLFKSDRGLLSLVASSRLWPKSFCLVLRGYAPNVSFGVALEAAVAKAGGKVRVLPMVDTTEVTQKARESDIGVFLPDISSPQNLFALPNKLFEYLQAGLMVIVPAGTDMADLVNEVGAGICIDGDAGDLTDLLGSLTAQKVDEFKMRAGTAGALLTWNNEKKIFLQLLGLDTKK